MTIQDKKVLIDGLKKLSADMADLAAQLEGAEAQSPAAGHPCREAHLYL